MQRSPPAVYSYSLQFERALATQLLLLAPMAPHFASELWSGFVSAPNRLDNSGEIEWDKPILEQKWPETDMDYELDLVCQVNGIENCSVKFPRRDLQNLTKEEAARVAMNQPEVKRCLQVRNVLDVVYRVHPGFDGVVNILTDQPPPKPKKLETAVSADS